MHEKMKGNKQTVEDRECNNWLLLLLLMLSLLSSSSLASKSWLIDDIYHHTRLHFTFW